MDYTKGRNLFSYKGIVAGKWWNNNSVLATASNKYFIFASAQIPIISNTPLTLQFWQPAVTATGSNRAWYGKLQYFDENKTYISGYRSTYFTTDHLIFTETPPDNAKYVAFSYQFERPVGDVNSTTVTVNTSSHRFKLEYGSEPTEWSPAPEDYDEYEGTIEQNILARNTITLAQTVDISAYYRFYKLQSSTANPPAKPTTITTLPPDGWSDTEPSYTEGSTNSLYFVDLTVFSDNTFDYSNVSLSSSYEAAKQAYNKSIAAMDKVDNLEIGGRNLFPDTGTFSGWFINYSSIVFQDGIATANSIETKVWRCLSSHSIRFSEVAGKDVTLSFDIRSDDYETLPSDGYPAITLYLKNVGPEANSFSNRIYGFSKPANKVENDWTRFTWTIPSISLSSFSAKYSDDPLIDDPWFSLCIWFYHTESCQVRRIKLETGNKATDWTPAPEDQEQGRVWYAECSTSAETTAKVATITPTTSNFRLNAGASVLVKFTATNSGAVGSLTLNVNGTGAKNIKYIYNGSISNIPSAGYLKANQTYQFYYDGSYWVVQMIYNTNSNNYDRRQHNQYIKAAAAITKAHIIAGTDAGYKMLASDLPFDLSHPILYSNVAIASGAQGYDVYEAFPSVNPSTTGTVEGLAKNKIVYLKGSLAGNMFTVAATNWLTCVIPTTEDGFYYIPLGMVANDATTKMYFSTSDKLYAYINGAFQRVDNGAAAIATATHQYFWHDTNGAHIGTVEGNGDSGYNSLWNSNGLMFRNNTNNLAAFTTSEIQFYDGTGNADSNIVARFGGDNTKIGKINDIHLEMDYHSLQLIDKEDNSYFYVSDLRNTQGEMTETFTGDGNTQTFFCMVRIASVSFVSINGVETSAYTFSGMGVSFTTTPADGAEIVVKYLPTETEKGRLKAYTFGIRGSGKVGAMSVAEGLNTVASGLLSHAEGSATNAQKDYSHAEGRSTTASYGAHAEGGHTNAYSDYAHAEGYYTEAAQYAHAEGSYTTASAAEAHAEGRSTTASGMDSHAEGYLTTASESFSHAEGHNTAANGYGSHAEGISTIANGNYSHAQGGFTIASQEYQTVMGKYNKESTVSDNFAVILGNGTGTSSNERSNALTVDWSGNIVSSGSGTFGGAISGTTGTFTGAISGASLSTTGSISGGAISGTTGTFTSNISAVKGTFSGAISGTTVTAGAVTSYVPTWGSNQTPVRYHCVVSAGICSFFFMGNTVAHSQGDTICTLPAGARPKTQVNVPFVKMSGNVVGVIQITTAGVVTVGFISSTTSTGRIYLNCTYPVV